MYTVAECKTLGIHGAASLVAYADAAKLLTSYLKMWLLLRKPDANNPMYVFVNHTGHQMTQLNVSLALSVAFSETYHTRVTYTKIRKAAVLDYF